MNKCLNGLFIVLMLLSFGSCKNKPKPKTYKIDLKESMMDADIAFSKLSADKGMKTAFMEYIDSNGIIQRPNTLPLKGGNAIDFISQADDTTYIMTWQPLGGTIAESGDLGYTYGIYSLQSKSTDSALNGTYLTIWKKQPDGKWKFEYNTGNEGIGQ